MIGLACPICSTPLSRTDNGKSLICETGHLFDLAKQGYINLLTNKHKSSKNPGDSAEMVRARTQFLDQGHYAPIASQLKSILQSCSVEPLIAAKITDIGCGEGYYTQSILEAFDEGTVTGIDISQPAIKAATRREKSIQWIVANAFHLPIETGSQDIATALFCRISESEISRVLKPGGKCIMVKTGNEHLLELRSILYDDLKPETEKSAKILNDSLHLLDSSDLNFTINLQSPEELKQLLMMTPHYWRVKPEKKERLESIKSMEITIDIRFDTYEKRA